jgi:hypothetical protein
MRARVSLCAIGSVFPSSKKILEVGLGFVGDKFFFLFLLKKILDWEIILGILRDALSSGNK